MESGTRAAPVDPATRRLFWRSQLIGWPIFGIVYFLALLPRTEFDWRILLAFKLFWAATGLAVSTVLAMIYRLARLPQRRPSVALGAATLLATAVGILWVVSIGVIAASHGHGGIFYTAASFPFTALNHVLILLAWSGAWLTLSYWRRSEAEQRKSLAAMGLAREAQLEMLRYQLNPHFLFNAMTSVRALVSEQPDLARETITRLSDFLRYTLGRRSGAMVTIAEEVQIIRDYLAIELVRFEERLAVDVSLDPAVADERVPSFLLHSLVENAIKHGTPADGRLRIGLRAGSRNGRLHLEVWNSGRYAPPDDGELHVGLRNVRERLAATYPGRHGFTIAQDGGDVRATISIDLAGGRP